MLPFPGSSTFDPEEELGELHLKLQRMKDEWKMLLNLISQLNLTENAFKYI